MTIKLHPHQDQILEHLRKTPYAEMEIDVSTVQLTGHGVEQLLYSYKQATDRATEARQYLDIAKADVERLRKCLTCEHELDSGLGGEAVLIQCKKCGFIWYD